MGCRGAAGVIGALPGSVRFKQDVLVESLDALTGLMSPEWVLSTSLSTSKK